MEITMKASELQYVGMALRLSAFDSSVSYIQKYYKQC